MTTYHLAFPVRTIARSSPARSNQAAASDEDRQAGRRNELRRTQYRWRRNVGHKSGERHQHDTCADEADPSERSPTDEFTAASKAVAWDQPAATQVDAGHQCEHH